MSACPDLSSRTSPATSLPELKLRRITGEVRELRRVREEVRELRKVRGEVSTKS